MLNRQGDKGLRVALKRAAEASKQVVIDTRESRRELAGAVGEVGIETAKLAGKGAATGARLAGKGIIGTGRLIDQNPKKAAVLAAAITAASIDGGTDVAKAFIKNGEDIAEEIGEIFDNSSEAELSYKGAEWYGDVFATKTVVMSNDHDRTLYDFIKHTLQKDAQYSKLPEMWRDHVIDAFIDLSRELNPGFNLDDFNSLIGKELVLPAEFSFRPTVDHVLTRKKGGYSTLQDMAELDGYDIRHQTQDKIYSANMAQVEHVPSVGEGYYVRRDGSMDSPDKLYADTIDSLEKVGDAFSAMAPDGSEWKFVLTDMMRNEKAQEERHSIKGSTHSTGRSFDVSDGRFVVNGKNITWSKFNQNGKASGRSEDADLIEDTLRPAFEEVALANGWVLFKEPGHWHVYVPKGNSFDFSDELGAPDVSSESGAEKESFRETGNAELPGVSIAIKEQLLKRYNNGMDYSVPAKWLEQSTIKRMDDLQDVWNHKLNKWSSKKTRPYIKHVVDSNITNLEGSYNFNDWYENQEGLQLAFSRYATDLFGKSDATHRANHEKNKNYDIEHEKEMEKYVYSELTRYITPEVVLAMIKAEFISHKKVKKYVDDLPRLFDGYNITFGPAINDVEFSSGYAQLILGTFEGLVGSYGSRIKELQDSGVFAHVTVPAMNTKEIAKNTGQGYVLSEVVDAMVLDAESASFWSNMSIVDHTKDSFMHFMKDDKFRKLWSELDDKDKIRFFAVVAPLANHMGKGNARDQNGIRVIWKSVLSRVEKGLSLQEITKVIPTLNMDQSRKRTARVGLETINELLKRVEPKQDDKK